MGRGSLNLPGLESCGLLVEIRRIFLKHGARVHTYPYYIHTISILSFGGRDTPKSLRASIEVRKTAAGDAAAATAAAMARATTSRITKTKKRKKKNHNNNDSSQNNKKNKKNTKNNRDRRRWLAPKMFWDMWNSFWSWHPIWQVTFWHYRCCGWIHGSHMTVLKYRQKLFGFPRILVYN